MGRDERIDDGRDRDREDPDREFHQAVDRVEVRRRGVVERERQQARDREVDLVDRRREYPRRHEERDLAHPRGKAEVEPRPPAEGHEDARRHGHLQEAAGEHARAEPVDLAERGVGEVQARARQGRDHREVEPDRRERRLDEVLEDVERRAEGRGEADRAPGRERGGPPGRRRGTTSRRGPEGPGNWLKTAMATRARAPVMTRSQEATLERRPNVPPRPFACSSSWSVGTKAAVIEPSARSRRKRFGRMIAVVNADISHARPEDRQRERVAHERKHPRHQGQEGDDPDALEALRHAG